MSLKLTKLPFSELQRGELFILPSNDGNKVCVMVEYREYTARIITQPDRIVYISPSIKVYKINPEELTELVITNVEYPYT